MSRSYPFALDALAARVGVSIDVGPGPGNGGGLSRLAVLTGADVRHLRRVRHRGLSAVQADRYAIACGLHPCEVWGDAWWIDAAPDLFAVEPLAVAS